MHHQDLNIKNTNLIPDKKISMTTLNIYENNTLEE